MNNNTVDNFRTLCHEFGHALHSKLNRDMEFLSAVSAEVKELASISMEYFAFEELANHISASDHANMMITFLEWKLDSLRSLAHAEEFQTRIYQSSNPNIQLVQYTINELLVKYDTWVRDRSWYEVYKQLSRHYHSHTYRSPLYNTEYIFANLGAIQLWQLYRSDKEKALENYIDILSSWSKLGVADTYQIWWLELLPSAEKIKELITFVEEMSKHNTKIQK